MKLRDSITTVAPASIMPPDGIRDLVPCRKCHGDPILTLQGETLPATSIANDGKTYLLKDLQSYRHGNQYFNETLSASLPLTSDLPDIRNSECQKLQYQFKLPTTSIIIVFYNEPLSTLLRTTYTLLDTTPPELLTEIIFVDDFSDSESLGEVFQDFVKSLSIFQYLRMPERSGLIKSRAAGALLARGDTLTFLDSHTVATPGWSEPILSRIAVDPHKIIFPVIDIIDSDSLEYIATERPYIGTFQWDMIMNWQLPAIDETRTASDPIPSIIMPGGLYTIDRDYFFFLGNYDLAMNTWGGENVEMSFRIWQCGGTIEVHPCSHFGHIYRKSFPFSINNDDLQRNKLRTAEVWLDGWKNIAINAVGKTKDSLEIGDLTERVQLRQHLHCQSFEWFLDNVYPLGLNNDPKMWKMIATGAIMNGLTDLCMMLVNFQVNPLNGLNYAGVWNCFGEGVQFLQYNLNGQIIYTHEAQDYYCLDQPWGNDVGFYKCHNKGGNQQWTWNVNDLSIKINNHNNTLNNCLTAEFPKPNKDIGKVFLAPCTGSLSQQWSFENKM